MPSFKPFSTGRSTCSLFDIRLENDFIVFRGDDHESSGQVLKGTLVLCLPSSLRIEDVHLRLTGTLRMTLPGHSSQKLDKTTTILEHRWDPFVGTHGKSMTLPAGNYEWPFEYMLPGDTAESVEGIPEASITYRLKATVGRGKLAHDLHKYKPLRIIRTLEPGALEFLHAMSVENIWPNKVDYSITIPQKAVVFGGNINMEMRLSPLLKGLELGEVTAKLFEVRDCAVQGATGLNIREHRTEREVSTWRFEVNREEHWHDVIEDTGQEGWAVTRKLDLPKKLRQCIQDLNHHGIKVRHKLKLTVALRNPDGHISELRATLPVSIFISPNMPLDEQGDIINQTVNGRSTAEPELGSIAPPGYGEHVLDQLFEDMETTGFQTPAIQSGISSPFYSHSRGGSSENLALHANHDPIPPAALSSRLANVSIDPSQRNPSFHSLNSNSGRMSPTSGNQGSAPRSEPQSTELSRSNSEEEQRSARDSSEDIDIDTAEFAELNRVPSYATAVRTPARSRAQTAADPLPDYLTAVSAPRTPPITDPSHDGLEPITEDAAGERRTQSATGNRTVSEDPAGARRAHIIQGRDQAV